MSNKEYKCIKSYPGVDIGAIAKGYSFMPAGWLQITHNNTFLFNQKESYFNNEFWEEIKCDTLMHTTEDGVLVYKLKHPRLYWVQLKNFNMGIDYENSLSDIDTKNYKYFYCEKNAKDWIEINKPKYSKKQIMDAVKTRGWLWFVYSDLIESMDK